MTQRSAIDWQTHPFLIDQRAAASALVVSLDDPRIAAACAIAATHADFLDRARPGATGREFFQKRRGLLRSFVAACANRTPDSIVVSYDSDGAPRIIQPELSLGISTAGRGNVAAVCCGDGSVGIDVELMDDALSPVENILHPLESGSLRSLESAARAHAFLRIWTMKEAYLKARRTGFRRDPRSVAILETVNGEMRIEDGGRIVPCIAEWREMRIGDSDVIAACILLT